MRKRALTDQQEQRCLEEFRDLRRTLREIGVDLGVGKETVMHAIQRQLLKGVMRDGKRHIQERRPEQTKGKVPRLQQPKKI